MPGGAAAVSGPLSARLGLNGAAEPPGAAAGSPRGLRLGTYLLGTVSAGERGGGRGRSRCAGLGLPSVPRSAPGARHSGSLPVSEKPPVRGGTGTLAARCPVRFFVLRSRVRALRGCGALPRGGARCGDRCSVGVRVPLPVVRLRAERSREPRTAPSCPRGCGRRCCKTRRARSSVPRRWIWTQEVRGVAPVNGRPAPPRTAPIPRPRTASTRLSLQVLGFFCIFGFFSLLAEEKKNPTTLQLRFGVTEPLPLHFVFLIWGHVRLDSAFESERWFRLQLRRSSAALPSVVFPLFGNKERIFLLFFPFSSTFN